MAKSTAKKTSPRPAPAKGGHRLTAETEPGRQAVIDAAVESILIDSEKVQPANTGRTLEIWHASGIAKGRDALSLLMVAASLYKEQANTLRDRGMELPAAETDKAAQQPELTEISAYPGRYKMGSAVRFAHVYHAAPQEKIEIIKQGLSAEHVGALAEVMAISKETLINTLRLSRATVNRKARSAKALSQDETERVLGVESLIGQVETMVMESGDPSEFDAAVWTSAWLNSPLPALDNQTPASYMDTIEGQKMVSNLLATAQTGAYA